MARLKLARMPTPKRDVLATSLALHEAEERVARLKEQLAEAQQDLKWAQINAKAARVALASDRLRDQSERTLAQMTTRRLDADDERR